MLCGLQGTIYIAAWTGTLDPAHEHDLVVDVKEGDAIIFPAGVAHCSLESSPDYEFVGLYTRVWTHGYLAPLSQIRLADHKLSAGKSSLGQQFLQSQRG